MTTRPPGTPDVDLTYDGAFGTINGGVFQTGVVGAGTGVFNSFLQIQRTGSEQGYNSDAAPQYDAKAGHDHSIQLSQIPVIVGDGTGGTTKGVLYREFLLDLNEANGATKSFISLDALQIYQEEAGNLTNFTPGSGFAGSHTNYLVYNLDAGGNHWVGMTDGLSAGSGQSDVRILIPDADFIKDAAHQYVTVYAQLGLQSGWNSDAGYEEWGLAAVVNHPVSFTSGPVAGSVGELADTTGSSTTDSTPVPSLTFLDPDVGDTHTVHVTVGSETWSGGSTIPAATVAGLGTALSTTLTDSTGAGTGTIDSTFSIADSNLDFLAAGETLTVVYNVQVSDVTTSATQTVSVTIDGANDAVNVTSGPDSGSVAEQPNMVGSSSLDSTTPVPTGTLAFTDVDLSDVHSVSVALDSAVWSVGPDAAPPADTFIDLQTALSTTLHDSTGSGSGGGDWTLRIPDKDLDFLSAGETLTATYVVTVSDGATSSSQTVTITATGAEDALTANPVTATLADTPFPDAGVTIAGGNLVTEGTSQGDASNTVTVTEINGDAANVDTPIAGAHGTLLVGADGTYIYTANSALDALQDGDTATDHFTFTVMDSLGATATQSLDFTITGTNDLPQVTGGVFFGDVVQNAGPSTTVNGGFESGDLSGWFATSNVLAEFTAFGPPLGNYDALLSGSGSLEQDIATTPGQHYQLSFYVAGDPDATGPNPDDPGAPPSTSFTAYWDGSAVLAQTDVTLGFTRYTFDVVGDATDSTTQFFIDYATDGSGLHFDELSVNPTPGPATESTSGNVSFSDAETGDTHTASFTPDNPGYVGTFSPDPVSESAGAGSVAWHFSVDNADIAFLTPGQALTQTYTVAIADDHGGTTTQSVGVTIHANDFLV